MGQAENSGASEHLPQLDGIRGLAILGVLLCHYGFALPTSTPHTLLSLLEHALSFGWMGVDLFFVLSGFLIGGILIANRNLPAQYYFKPFYTRRFFRIVPLYAVAIGLYLSTGLFSSSEAFLGSGNPISWLWYATFTQNIEGALFNDAYLFGHSWSLAVEEQFYLLIPLAIWLIPSRFFITTVIALIVCSVILRTTLIFALPVARIDKAVHTLLPCRMDALLIGVACAWLVAVPPGQLRIGKRIINALFLTTLPIVLIFVGLNWNYWAPQMMTIGFTIVAISCGLAILISVTDKDNPLVRTLASTPLRWLGRRAYFLYIFHLIFPSIVFALANRAPQLHGWIDAVTFILSIVTMFAVAEISWQLFEDPLIQIGRRFRYSTLAPNEADQRKITAPIAPTTASLGR